MRTVWMVVALMTLSACVMRSEDALQRPYDLDVERSGWSDADEQHKYRAAKQRAAEKRAAARAVEERRPKAWEAQQIRLPTETDVNRGCGGCS